MRYGEAVWRDMERSGALDYADRRQPTPPPRLIECQQRNGYHPDGLEWCQEEQE